MNLHLIKLPEDRDEMISMAQHFWEIQVAASNRKRKTADDSSNSSRKTRKTARGPRDQNDRSKNSNTNNSSSKPYLNPTRDDGKPKVCYNCGSERHYANKCSEPKKDKNSTTIQSATQGNGRGTN
jgi:hypothetical protein